MTDDPRPTDELFNEFELVTRRAYAKRKGWAPSHVVRLCRDGKIPLFIGCPACGVIANVAAVSCTACGQAIAGVVDERKARINPAAAERLLLAVRDPAKAHVAARHAAARAATEGEASPTVQLALGSRGADEPTGYARLKERDMALRIERAELELAKERGELGRLVDMRSAGQAIGQQVREALTNLLDRLAPVLAAEHDEAQVRHLMTKEVSAMLAELHRRLGGSDSPGG